MERDETFIPKTRASLGIRGRDHDGIDWEEYFGDTPIYTLFYLVRQQLFGFPGYFCKLSRSIGRSFEGEC